MRGGGLLILPVSDIFTGIKLSFKTENDSDCILLPQKQSPTETPRNGKIRVGKAQRTVTDAFSVMT